MLPTQPPISPDNAPARLSYALTRCWTWPLTVALILGTASAWAFDMNSNAPISISANSARLDDDAGRATYTGNVVVVQEQTKLFADRVELYRDRNGLSRIQAFGDPARYEQAETPENPATDASAEEIEFESAENLLTFRTNAVIRQSGDIFRGDVIRYNTEERIVTAERDQSEDGSRVEMVIQPRQNSGDAGDGGDNGAADGE